MTDLAGVLDAGTRDEVESLARDLERRTTAELAVVTVPSLEGMTIEQYAVTLFKAWGLGKKDKNNGVLLLVAPSERKVRIEVGYGLEATLPDGLCGEIIRQDVVPAFRAGQIAAGIAAGARGIAGVLSGQARSRPSASDRGAWPVNGQQAVLLVIILAVLGYRLWAGSYAVAGQHRRRGGFYGGGFLGGGGWSSGGFSGGGGGFGGFSGGFSGGGGASGSW